MSEPRKLTREEIATLMKMHDARCLYCRRGTDDACGQKRSLTQALAYLDERQAHAELRGRIETLYRQYRHEHDQQKDHPDEQVRLHAAIMEGTLFDLRCLTAEPTTTTEGRRR